MATADQFITQAAKYIGVSGTNNIFNRWYWGHDCYDPNVYPWCAAFQSYVGVHDLNMPFQPSASAAGVAWQGTRVKDEEARKGDWVLFNWDGKQDFSWANHIGVVEWSDINGSGYFGTIEGNTGSGEGSVMRQTRYNWGSYATAFFRPPYKDGDKDMTPEQNWNYKDKKTSGNKTAFQLLSDIHKACGGSFGKNVAAFNYKNEKMNGNADVYQLITDMHKTLLDIDERLKKLDSGLS